MSSFLNAYIACALWSSTDEDGEPLDKKYSVLNFAPQAMAEMEKDCSDFLELCECEGVSPFPNYGNSEFSDLEMSGHDFWLTRNGHGAGYWDRGLGEHGDKLSALAKTYGSCDIYVGDDGKLYI